MNIKVTLFVSLLFVVCLEAAEKSKSLPMRRCSNNWLFVWCRRRGGGESDGTLPCNFNLFDANRDGSITLEEFQRHVAPKSRPLTETIFYKMDADADAAITEAEFKDSLPTLKAEKIANC
ncbi:uncharacterized protein LOC133193612 [Saccostrea echinata]|uniref:uncharacterized protein LOC133193612 n=1 Tax=Saccostrea echinata TaxID=191078 RepID=UPI002A81B640|nr:uncharacterized protein LOC133193612 [Saccostrea echinata]